MPPAKNTKEDTPVDAPAVVAAPEPKIVEPTSEDLEKVRLEQEIASLKEQLIDKREAARGMGSEKALKNPSGNPEFASPAKRVTPNFGKDGHCVRTDY